MEEINENKYSKKNRVFIIVIICSTILIIGCLGYLFNSFRLIKKYDVDSFKLGGFEIPTFNSALNSKKKLVAAFEKNGVITLKYDIKKISLNDVYAYLEKLSLKDYVVVNLEDLYMRTVNKEDNIQIKITVGSNHLVFDYNIGIDKEENEEKPAEETSDEQTKETKENASNLE